MKNCKVGKVRRGRCEYIIDLEGKSYPCRRDLVTIKRIMTLYMVFLAKVNFPSINKRI